MYDSAKLGVLTTKDWDGLGILFHGWQQKQGIRTFRYCNPVYTDKDKPCATYINYGEHIDRRKAIQIPVKQTDNGALNIHYSSIPCH